MYLSKHTVIKLNDAYSNIIGHMNYAAYKLWNVLNYERRNWKTLGLDEYPDWYYQKATHKDNIWYKQLPSQSAQEVCKLLDKSWKSFFVLNETGGIKNPKPPRFKDSGIAVTYMQNGIVSDPERFTVRLAIPKQLKVFMKNTYGIEEQFIYLTNPVFAFDNIKQITLNPPKDGQCDVVVVYEVPNPNYLKDNLHYLSIDLGLHNLMTCVDSLGCDSFIVGRKYLSICRYYDKKISKVQKKWYAQQSEKGVEYPKSSKHIKKLYVKKKNHVNDYLHKITDWIVKYCIKHHIHTVIIGDITGIRKDNDLGSKTNQKLHGLPYSRIYLMLEYKLSLHGIRFIMQNEAYTSQCSPLSKSVCKSNARKSKRIHRGLYADNKTIWNADAVGAYNILRTYLSKNNISIPLPVKGLSSPRIINVAV